MSEEEKQAIKFLQKLEFDEYEWWYSGEEYKTKEEDKNAFEKAQKIIIDLIEKQQKQLEEYKSGEVFTAKQMHYIEDNYIDKDKIIEKIKILENINDSLKFVENRGYEPENYIINSNKYIINFLNKILEGGAK